MFQNSIKLLFEKFNFKRKIKIFAHKIKKNH